MLKNKQHVMVRATLMYSCGIALSHSLNLTMDLWAIFFIMLLALIVELFSYFSSRLSQIMMPALFLMGIGVGMEKHHAPPNGKMDLHLMVIKEKAIRKEYGYRFIARHCKTETDVQVFVLSDSVQQPFLPGQLMVCRAQLQEISAPAHPFAFDYRAYLEFRGVYSQMFVRGHDIYLPPEYRSYRLERFMAKWRDWMINRLQKNIQNRGVRDLMLAMVLGVRDDMDEEIKSSFRKSGVVHILVVSGWHVGLIYLLAWQLMFFLRKKPMVRYLLVLLLIWAYALLTGLKPPVQRAGIMISLYILGRIIYKKPDLLAIIAFSALLQLIINPRLLFDVGFQLSYSAVLGILFFLPLMRPAKTISKFYRIPLELAAVSIAAQLGTAPIILNTFHQLPVYFIFSNLLIYPFSVLIMPLGLLHMALQDIPLLGMGMLWIMENLGQMMIYLMDYIAHLPFSTLQIPDFHVSESILLIAIVALFYQLLWRFSFAAIRNFLVVVLLVVILRSAFRYRDYTIHEHYISQQSDTSWAICIKDANLLLLDTVNVEPIELSWAIQPFVNRFSYCEQRNLRHHPGVFEKKDTSYLMAPDSRVFVFYDKKLKIYPQD